MVESGLRFTIYFATLSKQKPRCHLTFQCSLVNRCDFYHHIGFVPPIWYVSPKGLLVACSRSLIHVPALRAPSSRCDLTIFKSKASCCLLHRRSLWYCQNASFSLCCGIVRALFVLQDVSLLQGVAVLNWLVVVFLRASHKSLLNVSLAGLFL